MKVKDIERTANVAWSPKNQTDILLAAGTAAQQLDASFNTSAALEIYALNLTEPGPDMVLKSTTPSEQRFHKIVWGQHGTENGNHGTIIGGCDQGLIKIFSASKLLKGENGLVCQQEKHQGPVHALDFNPFQHNLFATGAGESEIYIWDLNNTNTPMTPGSKSQPLEDVLSISWNRQVQHILASTFAPKCVIWDLRKNEPIIKLTDTVSRVRWKVVAWHPEVATQLCLGSEEDHSPVIQLWDLRFATSPLKTLENHQRGVLSLAWCSQDPDLLVSCGKDNRILAWNPNSTNDPNGEVLSEIAKTNQWSFDVQWCPRNPAIIACPGFDGHVSVYSLMGGKTQQIQTTDKIADSFPGMEGYVQAPVPQQSSAPVSVDLSKPPKWMKRPVGASFGFGGKLVSFENEKAQPVQPGQTPLPVHRTVQISQVITEPELVKKSAELEQALEYGNFIEYCRNKAESTDDQHKKYIWHFLKANFEENPRVELLNLLGYRIEDVNNKLNQFIGNNKVEDLTNKLNNINRIDDPNLDIFDNLHALQDTKPVEPFKIKTGDDTEGLITQALLLGNVEAAVELCLKDKRFADAIIIAMTGGSDLLARTQHAYLDQCEGYVSSLISALVSEDWASVINNCDLSSWKEALAATLTHSTDETLPLLCEQLGRRLETESDNDIKLKQDSQLCYICSGSFDKLVNSWTDKAKNSTDDLQELVELVMFLQKSIERQGRQVQISGALADLLAHYSSLLASQGNLSTALAYLSNSSQDEKISAIRERLYVSLGRKPGYGGATQQQSQVHPVRQAQARRTSSRQSFSHYPDPFNTGLPPAYSTVAPPISTVQPWHTQSSQVGTSTVSNSFAPIGLPPGGGASSAATGLHQPPPPPKVFSPPPTATSGALPPTQPPQRPTSVGPSAQGGSTGLPSRNKYVLDPSVSSNQYGIPPTRNPYQPSSSTNFNTPLQSIPPFQNNALNNPYNHNQPPQPAASLYNPPPPVNHSMSGQNPGGVNSSINSSYVANPLLSPAAAPSSAAYNEVGQPAVERHSSHPSAPGWNDPPLFSKPSRSQQMKQEAAVPPTPITHPIYGTAPAQPTPGPTMNNGYTADATLNQRFNNLPPPPLSSCAGPPVYGQQNQDGGGGPQMFQPHAANPPPYSSANNNVYSNQQVGGTSTFNRGTFKQDATTPNYNTGISTVQPHQHSQSFQQPQQSQQSVVKEDPQPVEKAPIPEEHIHMKTVFDELKYQCSCVANNPQTKRKLDDVGRKLEILYDLLRDRELPPDTLASLHQIVQLVQNGNYTGGLALHTQMIQGSNFAQIAGFMPGLKILLQCALQLQVYIR